jgi:hypothetical protein
VAWITVIQWMVLWLVQTFQGRMGVKGHLPIIFVLTLLTRLPILEDVSHVVTFVHYG